MTHWTLEPIFDSYAAVALLAAGMGVLLLVGPNFRQISRRRRAALIAMRALVILLMVMAMLRPARVSTASSPQSAVLLVMFDRSRSMQLPHASGGDSRWQAQLTALRDAQDELGALAADLEVKVFGYDHELHPAPFAKGRIEFPPDPTGQQTDIGTTLDEAVRRELGHRIAGVILLGDGAQTAFAPRVEVQQAGRMLARLETPLYTVAFGPPGDVAQSRDLAVENLPEQYTVFVKNELPVKGLVRIRGYVNQAIPVELTAEDGQDRSFTVGTVTVQAREDGQQVPVEIPFIPTQPGQYKLTLRAAQQSGELVTSNNELSAFVTVLEGGLRVLYLYGDLLGEQRLLRRSLDASPDIQLDDAFVDPRNRDRWPVDLGPLLSATPFDVILLESVDAAALGDATLKAMAVAVEQGKGLMMVGGFNSFGPGGYAGSPLSDLLPVEMGRLERQGVDLSRPISRDLHLWGTLPLLPVRPHPILRLASDDNNAAVWKSLPPLQGANRFAGVKPRAQILAETPSGDPLLVSGEYGKGRVLAFAGNTTHRWWNYGRQSEHRRFWRQAILWLAQRDEASQNEVWIKLPQRRYDPGARVTFRGGARAPTGDPIPDATITAVLVTPDGQRQPVPLSSSFRPRASSPAPSESQLAAADAADVSGSLEQITKPGDYLIELQAHRSAELLGTARAHFQVLDRDAELGSPAPNYDLLARVASLTQPSGGRLVAAEQLPALIQEIHQRRPQMQIEVQSRWQFADTALDAWLFLLGLVALLGTEWGLRKKWGLV